MLSFSLISAASADLDFLRNLASAGTTDSPDYKCALRHDECDRNKQCHPEADGTWKCKTELNFARDCTLTEDVGMCINHYKPENIEFGLEHPLLFVGGYSNSKLFLEDAGTGCAKGADIEGDQIFPPLDGLFGKLVAKIMPQFLAQVKAGELQVDKLMETVENEVKKCYADLMILSETQDGNQGVKLRAGKNYDLSSGARKIPEEILTFFKHVGYVEGDTFKYMPYDFRLSPDYAQSRDGQCDIFKKLIEEMVSKNEKPVVVATHSNGGNIALSCFQYISRNNGEQWFDDNVQSFVPIAMPIAGAKDITLEAHGLSKEVQAILDLSGDPAELRMQASMMFRSWTGTQLLFPRGGNNLWLSKEFVEYGYKWKTITGYCNAMKDFLTPKDSGIPLCDISKEKIEVPSIFDHFRNTLVPLKSMYCLFGGGIETLSKIIMNRDGKEEPLQDRYWESLQYNDDGDSSVNNISAAYMCHVWQKEATYRQKEDTHIALKQYIHVKTPEGVKEGDKKDWVSAVHSPLLANVSLAMDLLTIAASRPGKSGGKTAALPTLPRENELNPDAKNKFIILDQTRSRNWFQVVNVTRHD